MERKDWDDYQYLKEKTKQIKVEVKPMNCSIFLNKRYIKDPGSGIHINPKAKRNILSISATKHFEHYEVITENKLKANHLSIKMSPIDEKEYPERVISWLMKRKNDPDNPVLSRAITEYFWSQDMLDEAKEEAYFCLGKSPEWYSSL